MIRESDTLFQTLLIGKPRRNHAKTRQDKFKLNVNSLIIFLNICPVSEIQISTGTVTEMNRCVNEIILLPDRDKTLRDWLPTKTPV